MTTLHIRLLGVFEVRRDEQPLANSEWHSHQVRTILKLLLARRGRVVPVDQLIELIWPGEDPAAARCHLHVRISQLRRALDPDDPDAHVLTVAGGYTFTPNTNCWIDTVEFETCARRGRRCQEGGDLAEAINAYESARTLYQGNFLEGDPYADWASIERERLRERFLTMLTELAECYARQGRYRRAITRCREVLANDLCREAVYTRLMLYHYYAGEQDRALRSYEYCRQVLANELGVEPLPQTTALYEQIREHRVPPDRMHSDLYLGGLPLKPLSSDAMATLVTQMSGSVSGSELLRVLGETLTQYKQWREAELHLQEAVTLAECLGNPQDLAQAHRSLGMLYQQICATQSAYEHLAGALALFERLGAESDAAATKQLLADLDFVHSSA
jgi:DNA-binding SARP family transcriptional activator